MRSSPSKHSNICVLQVLFHRQWGDSLAVRIKHDPEVHLSFTAWPWTRQHSEPRTRHRRLLDRPGRHKSEVRTNFLPVSEAKRRHNRWENEPFSFAISLSLSLSLFSFLSELSLVKDNFEEAGDAFMMLLIDDVMTMFFWQLKRKKLNPNFSTFQHFSTLLRIQSARTFPTTQTRQVLKRSKCWLWRIPTFPMHLSGSQNSWV